MTRFIVFALVAAVTCFAEQKPALWVADLEHYTPAERPDFYAWRISPAWSNEINQPIAPPADFAATLAAIVARDQNPRIKIIAIDCQMDDLQGQVIEYLVQHGAIVPATATRPMHWALRHGAQGRIEMVKDAVLHSPFVLSLDAELKKHGKRIVSVQLEKLLLNLEKEPPVWLAGLWLDVDK